MTQKFNEKVFIDTVKNIKDSVKNVLTNSMSKNLVLQSLMDNDYSTEDVYLYLRDILEKEHPDYRENYEKQNWSNVYNHFIKEEQGNKISSRLQEKLDEFKGHRPNEEELRREFFSVFDELGISSEVLEIDMSIDRFGWKTLFDTLLSKGDGVKVDTPIIKGETEESEGKRGRKKYKYVRILQLSLEGTLVKEWGNKISDIIREHPELNHSSISKCLSGNYKTTGGYKWKGITSDENSAA